MKFSEWLKIKISESSRARASASYRPEINELDIKLSQINIGDIVELGPETEHQGKKANKIGKIKSIRGYDVIIHNLLTNKLIVVNISNLYDKEDLKGIRLTPSEERELALLGGKKLWIKLSDRQYKKFKSQYEVKLRPIMPETNPEDSGDDALRKMFSKKEREPEKKEIEIFSKEKEKPKQPLQRFIKKDITDLFGGR